MLEKGFQRKQRRLTLLHVRRHHVTEAGAGGLAFRELLRHPQMGRKLKGESRDQNVHNSSVQKKMAVSLPKAMDICG